MDASPTHVIDIQIKDYISQLTPIERKVLKIAEEHLESSFDIKKSIGFIEWLQDNQDQYIS